MSVCLATEMDMHIMRFQIRDRLSELLSGHFHILDPSAFYGEILRFILGTMWNLAHRFIMSG